MDHSAIRHGRPAHRRADTIRACRRFMRSNRTPAHEFRGVERITSRHRTKACRRGPWIGISREEDDELVVVIASGCRADGEDQSRRCGRRIGAVRKEARRRWTVTEKVRIVWEMARTGAGIREIGRRHVRT